MWIAKYIWFIAPSWCQKCRETVYWIFKSKSGPLSSGLICLLLCTVQGWFCWGQHQCYIISINALAKHFSRLRRDSWGSISKASCLLLCLHHCFLERSSLQVLSGKKSQQHNSADTSPQPSMGWEEHQGQAKRDEKSTKVRQKKGFRMTGPREAFSSLPKTPVSNSEFLLLFIQQKVSPSLSVTEWCSLHTKQQLQRVIWTAPHIFSCNKEPC